MGLFSLTGFTVDVEVITGLILSVVTLNSIFCANLKPASSVIVTMNESWPTSSVLGVYDHSPEVALIVALPFVGPFELTIV